MLEEICAVAVHSPYNTRDLYHPTKFRELVETAVEDIRQIMALHPEIEAIAATGNSGVPLMGAVCAQLCLAPIAVRKSVDTESDSRLVNGYMGCKAYLFLDDLIDTGKTMRHVIGSIEAQTSGWLQNTPKCAAVYLYDGYGENSMYVANGRAYPVYLRHNEVEPIPADRVATRF